MAKNKKKTAALAVALWLSLGSALTAHAQQAPPQEPNATAFSADSVDFDSTTNTLIANGNVELERDGRRLSADTIRFQQDTGTVMAEGNIILREVSGETLYADAVQVTDDLRDGFIKNVLVRFADDSRFVAAQGTRHDSNRTVLNNAAFTPCNTCENDPTAAPIWSLSAREIEHNQETKRITYRDAFLEIYDVPVLYIPYFQHADPSVKKESGFLSPTFARSTNRGSMVQAPFYWAIAPHRDVTVTPYVTSRAGQLGLIDYREHLGNGTLGINASVGNINKVRNGKNTGDYGTHAHINAFGTMQFNEAWRGRVQIQRATGRNYLRRFDIDKSDVLTSAAHAERFGRHSYASIRSLSFQSLRADERNDEQPIVIPEVFMEQRGTYTPMNVEWTVDGGTSIIERRLGSSRRRASFNAHAAWSTLNTLGGLLTLESHLQNDVYNVHEVTQPTGSPYGGSFARSIPQAAATYRHPFVRRGDAFTQLIEPIVSVSLSPTALNDTRIPNEDSQVFEFDDANLFSLNRFTGSDRVSEGSRIDYGINLGLFHSTAGKANLFIGQSYQLQPAKGFIVGSGLEDQLSDTVGRFSANYQNLADFTYRFRIDQNSGRFHRHDASLTLNTAPVQWTASYLFLDEQANRALNILNTERREEVSGRASLLLSDAWELSGNITRDINQGSTRYAGLGLSYFLDCIAFNLDIDRDFTTDGQLPRETRILFRLNFKHLGDNSVDSYLRSRNRLTGRERTFSDFFND